MSANKTFIYKKNDNMPLLSESMKDLKGLTETNKTLFETLFSNYSSFGHSYNGGNTDTDFASTLRTITTPMIGVSLIPLYSFFPIFILFLMYELIVPNETKTNLSKNLTKDMNIPFADFPNIAKIIDKNILSLRDSVSKKNSKNLDELETLNKMKYLHGFCNDIMENGDKISKEDCALMLNDFKKLRDECIKGNNVKEIVNKFKTIIEQRSNKFDFIKSLAAGNANLEERIRDNYKGTLEFLNSNLIQNKNKQPENYGKYSFGIDKFIRSFEFVLNNFIEQEVEERSDKSNEINQISEKDEVKSRKSHAETEKMKQEPTNKAQRGAAHNFII